MNKLFIAIDIPDEIKAVLLDLQPMDSPQVSLVATNNMHLTLLYIGNGEIEEVQQHLGSFTMPSFNVNLTGIGHFSARKSTVLWAGLNLPEALIEFHEKLTQQLSPVLSDKNIKPYSPHITLARCSDATSDEMIQAYLNQRCDLAGVEFEVSGFSLYSSHQSKGGVYYKKQHHYPFEA